MTLKRAAAGRAGLAELNRGKGVWTPPRTGWKIPWNADRVEQGELFVDVVKKTKCPIAGSKFSAKICNEIINEIENGRLDIKAATTICNVIIDAHDSFYPQIVSIAREAEF